MKQMESITNELSTDLCKIKKKRFGKFIKKTRFAESFINNNLQPSYVRDFKSYIL